MGIHGNFLNDKREEQHKISESCFPIPVSISSAMWCLEKGTSYSHFFWDGTFEMLIKNTNFIAITVSLFWALQWPFGKIPLKKVCSIWGWIHAWSLYSTSPRSSNRVGFEVWHWVWLSTYIEIFDLKTVLLAGSGIPFCQHVLFFWKYTQQN